MRGRAALAAAVVAVSALPAVVRAEAALTCLPTVAGKGGDPACEGVRPGGIAFNPETLELCTIGFLLRGSDGATYALTGHLCAQPKAEQSGVGIGSLYEEHVWRRGDGPVIEDGDGTRFGRAVYDVIDLFNGHDLDVALIKLDKGVRFDPRMCLYGGPSRVESRITTTPEVVAVYGQGNPLAVTSGHSQQDVLLRGLDAPDIVYRATDNELPNAGAPVVMDDDSRAAVGVMSKYARSGASGSPVFRLGYVIARLEPKLRLKFRLLTAGERSAAL